MTHPLRRLFAESAAVARVHVARVVGQERQVVARPALALRQLIVAQISSFLSQSQRRALLDQIFTRHDPDDLGLARRDVHVSQAHCSEQPVRARQPGVRVHDERVALHEVGEVDGQLHLTRRQRRSDLIHTGGLERNLFQLFEQSVAILRVFVDDLVVIGVKVSGGNRW